MHFHTLIHFHALTGQKSFYSKALMQNAIHTYSDLNAHLGIFFILISFLISEKVFLIKVMWYNQHEKNEAGKYVIERKFLLFMMKKG